MKRAAASLALISVAALAACSSGTPPPNGNGACGSGTYPAGPYGVDAPSTIADLQLFGRDHDAMGMPADDARVISFHDYYQQQQASVLVVLTVADWCGPCKTEQSNTNALYQAYQSSNPGEVAFLESILQDNQSNAAPLADVDAWAESYHVPFTMAADPESSLGSYFDNATFPGQMIIRTCDMSIRWKRNGLVIDSLKAQIDAVLAGG